MSYFRLVRLFTIAAEVVFVSACGGGGSGGGSATPSPPAIARFSPTASMSIPRSGHTATLLQDGTVLVAGGFDTFSPTAHAVASAEIYDPATDTFKPTGGMASARMYHAAELLQDGRVAVIGGTSSLSVELFDPVTGTFVAGSDGSAQSYFHLAGLQSALLSDGRVVVRGQPSVPICHLGCTYNVWLRLYDPLSGTFTDVTGNTGTDCVGRTMTLLADGRLILAGGLNGDSNHPTYVGSVDLVDPTAATATSTVPMSPRSAHAAIRLDDGRVLLSGGFVVDAKNNQTTTLADVLLFDPAIDRFTRAGRMLMARGAHVMTLLTNGGVLVTAGLDGQGQPINSAELFNPTNHGFESVGTMMVTRSRGYTVTALTDGRALIVGGLSNETPTATAELFE